MHRLDASKIPRHVAIIPDGNGRWAESRGLPRNLGHKQGTEAVRGVVRAAHELGVDDRARDDHAHPYTPPQGRHQRIARQRVGHEVRT